ncbi:MAG: dehydrogenase, partial [Bacteroidetes bacterium]|nr:dehydrogenase [Bacteroidota bacterium]
MSIRSRQFIFMCVLAFLFGCQQQQTTPSFEESVSSLHPSGEDSDTLYVPEGLKAELWAESPQFYNPTNIDVDNRGRIWVTEAVDYRDFQNKPENGFKHFPKGDRVVILEDTNGDGRADSSKVFVQDEDLQAPLGIAVFGNKVVVSSSPSVIVYTDEDGDDKPDHKETFLTGFGGYDHDHGLHAVVGGPDGKWYLNAGNAGPHIVTDQSGWTLRAGSIYTGGSPYNTENSPGMVSDDGRVWVGGLALRVNPDGTGLKVMGHNFRNSYELALDSYGNMWQNDNDDQVQSNRTTWLMEGGNAGYFSRDGSRYWQADRRPGQDIPSAHWHQKDPGVMPAGDITGAGAPTGIMLYESDALGPQYQGMMLSADAGRNVIFGYKPQKKGAGFTLKRQKFISSVKRSTADYVWNEEVDRDKWFRPSDVAVGTDGAIYIADWYDPVVGGHQMRDKRGYGRIYRISPEDRLLITPDINLQTTEGQIKALLNPAVNVRYSGFRRLMSQGDKVLGDVKQILSSKKDHLRARAVWLLANLGPNGIEEVEKILSDSDEKIRVTAFRALRQTNPGSLLDYARILAGDPSPAVRREVAIALRDISFEDSHELILELARYYDGDDPWYLHSLGISLEKKEEEFYPMIKQNIAEESNPVQWSDKVADLVWELHPKSAIEDLKHRIESQELSKGQRLRAITALGFIDSKKAAETMISLSESEFSSIAQEASWWLQYRKTNDWSEYLEDWQDPLEKDPLKKHPEMLEWKKIVSNRSISDNRRIEAARMMAKNSAGGIFLVSLAARDELPSRIKQAVSKDIFKNPDRYIRTLAEQYFDRPAGEKTYDIQKIS